MGGVILLDEGALHEAILEAERERRPRVWFALRLPEASAAPPGRHYDRSARSNAGRGSEGRGESPPARALPEARSRSLKRRSGAPSGAAHPVRGAHYELPKRLIGAPPPSFRGTGRKDEGDPALSSTGRRSVG